MVMVRAGVMVSVMVRVMVRVMGRVMVLVRFTIRVMVRVMVRVLVRGDTAISRKISHPNPNPNLQHRGGEVPAASKRISKNRKSKGRIDNGIVSAETER
jgi:hypothetical protein